MLKKFILIYLLLATSHQYAASENIFEDISIGNKIVLSTRRIYLEEFPDAYNPSIIKAEQGYIFTFRYTPDRYKDHWLSYVGIVLLDDAFQPISKPQLLNIRPKNSKTPSQAEDARIFAYKDRLFIIYNDNVDIVNPKFWERRYMYIAELSYEDDSFILSPPLRLNCIEKYNSQKWEKNWVPFEWDERLLITYSISPHEVINVNLFNGECFRLHDSNPYIEWTWGKLRGSTPTQLVDGEFLAFFHSGNYMPSPASEGYSMWHYFMGAYTFKAEPPFSLTKISPRPIIADGFYEKTNTVKLVVFPGGYVVDGPYIYMAYGRNDEEMWMAVIDKQALMDSLIPIAQIP